jgi:hypothetical protein
MVDALPERVNQALYHHHDILGWPVSIRYVKSLAISLLQAKGDHEPLGQHWYKNFLARYPDFKTAWSRSLDQPRKDATGLHDTAVQEPLQHSLLIVQCTGAN